MASDFNIGPTIFGEGLGALHYLQDQDKLKAQLAQRNAEAAARAEQAQAKAYATAIQGVNADTGLTYGPLGRENVKKFFAEAQEIMRDKTLGDTSQRLTKVAEKRALLENSLKAGTQAEQHVKDTFGSARTNPNFYQAAVIESLRLQQHRPDGSIIPPEEYNPQAAEQAVMHPKNFNLGNVYKGLAKDLFQRDSEELEKAARPGGIGTKAYLESNAMIERDPVTLHPILNAAGEPMLKITPSTILAAKSNPFVAMHLGSMQAEREKMEQAMVQKMQQNQPLSEEEHQYLEQRQSGAQPSFGQDLAQQLTPYINYSTRQQETFRPAPRPHVGRAATAPKFTVTGGTNYAPELMGGQGAGGTLGLTALASGDPLQRFKPDGSATDFGNEQALHPRFNRMQNGRATELVANNQSPQSLRYIKPQLYLTAPDGRIITPTDPALLTQAQAGNRRPLLEWVRAQREQHPDLKPAWHFLAVPGKNAKLSAAGEADRLYQRLRADPNNSSKPDDVLHGTAQKLAEQQAGSLLIPYTRNDKNAIDSATGYYLRKPKPAAAMQAEFDRWERETAPRPPEARTGLKAAPTGGPWQGLTTQPPKPAPAAPAAKKKETPPTSPNSFGFKFKK